MLEIACPWCGPRPEAEFRCGGEIPLVRPPLTATDVEWTEYLYHRTNTKGLHRERWQHLLGCGMWIAVTRSTVDHSISATDPLVPLPKGESAA